MSRRSRQKSYPAPYKSNFEYLISVDLNNRGIPFLYEPTSFEYYTKVYQSHCVDCGSNDVFQRHWYTPDWYLPSSDIYVESKGKQTAKDRKILQSMKEDHPEITIKVLLQQNNWVTKAKKQRYGDWLDKNEIEWVASAKGLIPEEWV